MSLVLPFCLLSSQILKYNSKSDTERWNYRTALDVPRAKKEAPLSWTLYWKSFFCVCCPTPCLFLQNTSTWKSGNTLGLLSPSLLCTLYKSYKANDRKCSLQRYCLHHDMMPKKKKVLNTWTNNNANTVIINIHLPMYVPTVASWQTVNVKSEATLMRQTSQEPLWSFHISVILLFSSIAAYQHHHIPLQSE